MRTLVMVGTLALCLPCAAADNLWNGHWRLAPEKGVHPGPTFTMSSPSQGEYLVDNGAFRYHFRCDSKDYPKTNHITVACVRLTANEMDIQLKDNGRPVSYGRWMLSADGKTQSVTGSKFKPDGSKESVAASYVRVSGTAGFFGGWKVTGEPKPELRSLETKLQGSVFSLVFPDAGQSVDMDLKGSDAPIHAKSDLGVTMAAKQISTLKLATVRKVRGGAIIEGSLTMTPDGNTLVYEWWNPGLPNVKGREVYQRVQ